MEGKIEQIGTLVGHLNNPILVIQGEKGDSGQDGKSAYDIWLEKGNTGTEEDFINSLRGTNGKDGEKGDPFKYEDFTLEQLEALRGPQGEQGIQGIPGQDGKNGEKGDPFTYEDFTPEQLEALRGEQGPQGIPGEPGADGYTPQAGVDYNTEAEKTAFKEELQQYCDAKCDELLDAKVTSLLKEEY